MLRPLAILALAVTSWSQVAAVHCGTAEHSGPVAALARATPLSAEEVGRAPERGAYAEATPAPPADAGAAPHDDHHPAAGARHPRAAAHEHESPEGNETCGTVMVCGTLMVASVLQARTIELPAASRLDLAPPARAVSVAPPSADPPPPRRLV
jgi:hypothetical protein